MNVSSRVTIDWEGSKLEWVNDARRLLLPRLLGDERFQDAVRLERRFEEDVSAWQARRAEPRCFRGVINIGNEIAAAVALLDKCKDLASLRYEPPMKGTGQTLDFCLRDPAGHPVWIDVKTVAPQWLDDAEGWQRFKTLAADFPDNVRFGVQRAVGGAGIFGQAIKTRWSFVMRTIEVEKKAELIPRQDRGPVWLMLCSDRFAWHPDELEDFADFYKSSRFRGDDWASNAITRYLSERKLTLSGSLAGFHYFGRRHDECDGQLRWAVRGPVMFSPR